MVKSTGKNQQIGSEVSNIQWYSGWWCQPIWKIISQIGSSPQIRFKKCLKPPPGIPNVSWRWFLFFGSVQISRFSVAGSVASMKSIGPCGFSCKLTSNKSNTSRYYMGVSKNRGTPNGWFIMENPYILKWMIWGYHYFRKHLYIYIYMYVMYIIMYVVSRKGNLFHEQNEASRLAPHTLIISKILLSM